jgi:branched-chain amino acid transport system substrate-binding protein
MGRFIFLLFCCLLGGCAQSGTSSAPEGETIRLVSSLPLTGSSRTQSETMVKGIQLALEEANYRVGKFKIDYHSWDDATAQAGTWEAAKEKENASRAADDPDVMAYIGTYNSGAAKIAIPILNAKELVMVSPANTYAGLTKPNTGEPGEPELYYPGGFRNFCRVVPADDLQGSAGAWWAHSLGVKSVYILDDKELYGRGIATVFEKSCQERKIEIKGHEGIDPKAPDFRAVVNKIRESGAELVYFGGTTQNGSGKMAKDLREGGSGALFMGPDATKEDAFLQAAGPAAEGALVTLGGLPPEKMNDEARAWFARYRKRYQSEPEAYAIYAYEATKVVLRGIELAGSKDRVKIREAIMSTKDYPGLLGTWSFDKNGDTTITSMSGFEVVGGKFEFSASLAPDQPPASLTLVKARAGQTQGAAAAGWQVLVEQLLSGLANGSLIAVIALGYTLVYGLVELINFAHGDVFMMGAMAALTGVGMLGSGNPAGALVVLLGAMVFAALLNRGIDAVAYRRLRGKPRLVPLITAIGVSFVLMNLGGYWKGWAPVYFPDLLGGHDANVFGAHSPVHFKVSQLIVILVALPLMAGLHFFIHHTKLGKAMRATAQNPQAALLMGIDTNATIAAAFWMGGALAGAAGFLYAFYNHEVRFDLGFRQGLNAFTAAVLGGIGNVRGAMLGGLIIGVVEALTAFYWAQAVAPAVVFAVLIVIILVKPTGLLGSTLPEKV